MSLSRSADSRPLPESFLFGVGNSDHQVEAYSPESADIRDIWDEARGTQARGRATDFRNRYREDVGLAKSLGCRMFRISTSWAWIEPEPGVFSEPALTHYRELVDFVADNGMEPMVTLHHFVWPIHIQEAGGMISDDFVSRFVEYTRVVNEALRARVRYWITFNEPNLLPFGYVKPWWTRDYAFPPGLVEGAPLHQQVDSINLLIHNLFDAHAAARRVIRELNPEALVSSNPSILGLPRWVNAVMDWNTKRQRKGVKASQVRRYAERPRVQRATADVVVAALSLTAEREEYLDLSEVYFVAELALLVRGDGPVVVPDEDHHLRVAVVQGSTAEAKVELVSPGQVRRAVSLPDAVKDLDDGLVDGVLGDDVLLAAVADASPNRYRILDERYGQERYAVGVAKGNTSLFDAASLAVRRFLDAGHEPPPVTDFGLVPGPAPLEGRRISVDEVLQSPKPLESRVGAPDVGGLPPAPPGTSLRRVQDRGYLIAGVTASPSPLLEVTPGGQLAGYEVDLAREIASVIFGDKSRVRFVRLRADKRLPALRRTNFFDSMFAAFSTLTTVANTNWWHLGMAGKLSEKWCPSEAIGTQDFVALDYYWGTGTLNFGRIRRIVEALVGGQYDRAPVWPHGLRQAIERAARLFPGMPVIVVENGCVESADGVDRSRYLTEHVEQVKSAVHAGVPVTGYLCWSITSNREWGLPFRTSNDFGLMHIHLDSDPQLLRIPTDSSKRYSQLIARGGIG